MIEERAVVMMVEALASEGGLAGRLPFMLKVSPQRAYPVAFGSRDLAERLMSRLDLGRKVWLESAHVALRRFPASFLSGKIVFFADRAAIDRFVNESDFVPLRTIEFPGVRRDGMEEGSDELLPPVSPPAIERC